MVAVTVLIACKDMASTLGETLEGIARQDWDRPWEVILADNGSGDGSVAVFEAFAAAHPHLALRRVDASARRGKSYALNLGVEAARGRAIVLNDADDVMAPGYLAHLGDALDTHDLVGGGNDFRRLNCEWVQNYRRGSREARTLARATFPPFLDFVGGNSMGFTRSLFDAIGGFRGAFEPTEDLDFCFRAQVAGYRIRFLPDATMHYRHRSDPAAIRRQAFGYAKGQVRLAAAYREHAGAWTGRWGSYFRGWRRVGGLAARRLVRRGDVGARALLAWHLGWQLGQTAGIVAFRAPPTNAGGRLHGRGRRGSDARPSGATP